MKTPTQTILMLVGMLLFSVCGVAMAQAPVVGVYGIHYGGKVQYHYRVTNYGEYPISAVWVGHDTQNDTDPYNSLFELKAYPSGMVSPNIPAASVTAPLGWAATFIGQEETLEHSIKWRMSGVGRAPIGGGQTLSGMSVTLDKMDSTYVTSHVTLYRWTPLLKDAELTVPLQRVDVAPPTLTVTLSPITLPENDRLVPITATLTVADDYDPQPEIRLDSIAVNEVYEPNDIQDASFGTDDRQFLLKAEQEGKNPLGRIYTVQYSATDGSGNISIATASVTVMRKQEDKAHTKGEAHKDANLQKQLEDDKPFWQFW